MRRTYTAQELAFLMGVSREMIRKRAAKERWKFTETPNQKGGGNCKLFASDDLPPSVQEIILAKGAEWFKCAAGAAAEEGRSDEILISIKKNTTEHEISVTVVIR